MSYCPQCGRNHELTTAGCFLSNPAERKTVPMEMLEVLDWGMKHDREELIAIAGNYGYTVTEIAKEEGR